MNLQQAAKEYLLNRAEYQAFNTIANISSDAFLAGAAFAGPAFAEWCSENDWFFWKDGIWMKKGQKDKTTAELYQLWQQSIL